MYRYIKSEKMNLELEEVRVMCLRTVCARKHKHQSACKLLSLSGFREMTGGSNLVVASLMRASESFIYKGSGFLLYNFDVCACLRSENSALYEDLPIYIHTIN